RNVGGRGLYEFAGPTGEPVDVLGQHGLAGPRLAFEHYRVAPARKAAALVQNLRDSRGGSEQQPSRLVHGAVFLELGLVVLGEVATNISVPPGCARVARDRQKNLNNRSGQVACSGSYRSWKLGCIHTV